MAATREIGDKEVYYHVWVSSPRYHRREALTYQYKGHLEAGSIVLVPLQRDVVPAIVVEKAVKPRFATKSILRIVHSAPLPKQIPQLISWLGDYYPAPFGQLVSLAVPQTLTKQTRKEVKNQPTGRPIALPPLTPEQKVAVNRIQKTPSRNILLHGDTGTGKTRVYLELIAQQLKKGRSALLLTPEIGLTPQLALASSNAFPGRTVVMHSDQTAAARRNAWLRILEAAKPLIVIGPRSALFAPLKNIGLIVIDECHEASYKQEQAPHYLATRVGATLASLHKAQLILGSATPLVADYFTFQEKNLPIIRMQEQAIQTIDTPPDITVTDLKKRELFTRSPWLSDQLLQTIETSLQNKQQSLIFLNRRGTARLILCKVCGWQALCPRCDIPLTYHGDKHQVQCHTCGFTDKTPLKCPDCGANDIIFRSIGTKSLVTELERLLPQAKIKRFDSDTTKTEKLEEQYQAIKAGEIDILVGTQIVGKGLDLPRLSVLGVVLADTSLSFPDYTAEERTYQLLTQVTGRINRGHVQGTAFVQTYHPNSPVLLAAIRRDYTSFYTAQLAERQRYGFPPFRHLLKLTCTRASATSAKKASEQLAAQLRNKSARIELIGPGPAFAERTHNRYRWQLVIKAVERSELINIIKELPANWSYDIDPTNLL